MKVVCKNCKHATEPFDFQIGDKTFKVVRCLHNGFIVLTSMNHSCPNYISKTETEEEEK